MERLLARLERTLGRFAIERLTTFIVGGMAMVFLLSMSKPELLDALRLEPTRLRTEPWRLITFLFLPPSRSPVWMMLSLYFTWLVGANLESAWGAFKLNVYYFLGALGTTVVAFILGPQGNYWLNTSLWFAFATVFPNYEILLFFILPIRVKWLALLGVAMLGLEFLQGDLSVKGAILIAFANYLLFFAGHLVALARGKRIEMRQAVRRREFEPEPERRRSSHPSPVRACAICGKTQDEGADIRVCSCATCGGPRELCLEHARDH
jgi:hypothetical protein